MTDEMWSECKHGMKSGCAYCHVSSPGGSRRAPIPKKRETGRAGLSEKMNDRMTALKKRLKEIRGE